MSRRKKYIRGKIYITNDSLFSYDGYSKKNRRIVAINNDRNSMKVLKIKSLYDKKGKLRKNLIPIEKYPDINKISGIDKKIYSRTSRNKKIKENKLKKTKSRLNKWDLKKIKDLYK